MKRFLSVWLVWIVAAVFIAAIAAAYFPLTSSARQTAEDDLSLLTDAAFTRLEIARRNADSLVDASYASLLGKSRAVARFLAHDDALLDADALTALCDLLDVSAIDVADSESGVIASSTPGRVGTLLLEEPGLAWTRVTLDDLTEQVTAEESDPSQLTACVPRTDIEGMVLVTTRDAGLVAAEAMANPEQVVSEMSFIIDHLSYAQTTGEDGAYVDGDEFCVRRTRDGVSFVAARRLSSVYLVRNGVTMALSAFMLVSILFSIVIQALLTRRPANRTRIRKSASLEALRPETQEDPPAEEAPRPIPVKASSGESVPAQPFPSREAEAPEDAPISADASLPAEDTPLPAEEQASPDTREDSWLIAPAPPAREKAEQPEEPEPPRKKRPRKKKDAPPDDGAFEKVFD